MKILNKFRATVAAALTIAMVLALTPNAASAEKASATDSSTASDAIERGGAEGEPVIRDNIFINGQDVGGMTREQATKALGASAGDATPVTLESDYGNIDTTLGDIGLTDNTEEVLDEAFKYGNTGNILKRYKDIEMLKTTPVEYTLERTVKENYLNQLVDHILGEAMRGDNSYSLNHNDDGSVYVIVEGKSLALDAPKTRTAIEKQINAAGYNGEPVSTTISFIDNQDTETKKQLQRVTTCLGEYTTDYGGSSESRKVNVQRAASLCDGHVVFPGEQFSVYNCIAPVDESNGYELAHAFVGTEVVDSPGGGVCQVATTLYNAAIRAELEITQRECHSMTVSYVPISADAAVAGGILDMKFVNNLDAPIYIEAGYDGTYLRFSIYGEEYRPSNRTIEFESVQTGVINPPSEPILTEDKTLKPGTQEVKSAAVTGYTGELWKHVYVDGVETETVLINTSRYDACAEKISINTDPPTEEDSEEDKPEDGQDPANTPDGGDKKKKKKTADEQTTDSKPDKKNPDTASATDASY